MATNEWRREYYKQNREKISKQQRENQAVRREENRIFIREVKNVPCADCGVKYPWYCMDFDHVQGEKEFNVSMMIEKSRARIQKEIDKCEVVCSNCHRERTYQASLV